MKTVNRIFIVSLLVIFSSCVSVKQFNETKDKLRNYALENENLKKDKMSLEAVNTEFKSKNEQLTNKNSELKSQLEEALYEANIQKQNLSGVEMENSKLLRQLEVLNSGSSAEIQKLLEDLNLAREDLNLREDKLRGAELELKERNAKLLELQNILTQKEQAVNELKNKVMAALVGFNNNGLTCLLYTSPSTRDG